MSDYFYGMDEQGYLPTGTVRIVNAIPKDAYRLRINSYFCVEQPTRPNAWWRFWQRVLLGWTWETL